MRAVCLGVQDGLEKDGVEAHGMDPGLVGDHGQACLHGRGLDGFMAEDGAGGTTMVMIENGWKATETILEEN